MKTRLSGPRFHTDFISGFMPRFQTRFHTPVSYLIVVVWFHTRFHTPVSYPCFTPHCCRLVSYAVSCLFHTLVSHPIFVGQFRTWFHTLLAYRFHTASRIAIQGSGLSFIGCDDKGTNSVGDVAVSYWFHTGFILGFILVSYWFHTASCHCHQMQLPSYIAS